jgi:hypothetical protein
MNNVLGKYEEIGGMFGPPGRCKTEGLRKIQILEPLIKLMHNKYQQHSTIGRVLPGG